jgi:Putative Ig domain
MVWLGLAAAPLSASAFALLGPPESWQSTFLGYERFNFTSLPDGSGWIIHGDDFAWHPHNLGEEFRWNNPVLYYSFDQSFLDYFGSSGVAAVDAAMAVFNNLTNVSSYSADLHEFPLEETRINYTASALHLFDLKSTVMELLIERLGLIDPERWAWCLRARVLPPGLACPKFDFSVVQRNFDPVTWEPSRYVNGNLFTYEIQQTCPPPYDFGDAVEFLVDPNGTTYSALATPKLMLPDATFYGYFHTGLTRDDIGGLRYLYATNNMNIEGAGTNTVTFVTDTNTIQLLFTSNLTMLAAQALTNNPAALQALYPNLSIASTTSIFTNIYLTNITAYFTNYPFDPIGTPPHLAFVTNRTLTVQTWFHYTFNNVVTFQLVNGVWTAVPLPDIVSHIGPAWITVQTTVVTNSPFAPVGTPPVTNTTTFTYLTNQVAGEYFIVPTNLCGIAVAAFQATLLIYDTNVVASATNAPVGFTNSQAFTQVVIDYFTNNAYLIYPILCLPNTIALRQGIEKVTFIRRDFDSLLGQFFSPVTNNYMLTAVTNYALFPQRIQRTVTRPDILFSASDLVAWPYIPTVVRPGPSFDLTGQQPNLVGPGNIRGPINFQFNKVGPIYVNGNYPLFVDEAGALLNFAWASYDATTNAPVIYPSGASIANLENQVLIQISPPYLPDGMNALAYRAQLQTSGATPNWQAPFTWSLAPASPGLPPGLSVSANGLISGTPVQAGFYNFIIQATDAVGRTAQQSYVINVLAHL